MSLRTDGLCIRILNILNLKCINFPQPEFLKLTFRFSMTVGNAAVSVIQSRLSIEQGWQMDFGSRALDEAEQGLE